MSTRRDSRRAAPASPPSPLAPAHAARPSADGVPAVLHVQPASGGACALQWLGAGIVIALTQLDRATLPAATLVEIKPDIDALRAFLAADVAFGRLVRRPDDRAIRAGFLPSLPALNAANVALCRLAFRLFESAVPQAAGRDMAAGELLAGRAWVGPDGAIIRNPDGHAAA